MNMRFGCDKEDDIEIPPAEITPHLLISSVRQRYLKFLKKLLIENYENWCQESAPDTIWTAARKLELHAASDSMVVKHYQKSITAMIKSLKKYTAEREIFPLFWDYCVQSQNKSTQTDRQIMHGIFDNPIIIQQPLDVKLVPSHNDSIINNDILMMENNIPNGDIKKDDIFAENGTDSVIDPIELSQEDTIFKEMEEIFAEKSTNMNDNKMIPVINTVTNETKPLPIHMDSEVSTNGEKHTSNSVNRRLSLLSQSSDDTLRPSQKYNYSIWPCEVYYKKKMLRETLDNLCEKSYRLHLKVKNRFVELFGHDSDDEQGLQSPNTSPDFARSCRQRAAPFVTRHLRPFFIKMRIQKHLSTPLMRHLLYKIMAINEYPDSAEVYFYIRQYFRSHPHIRCRADF